MSFRNLLCSALLAILLPPGGFSAAEAADSIQLERLAAGLDQPLLVTHAGDGSDRLFVVEQPGRILIYREGRILEQPFLDVTSRISTGGERGLLGLAFHPDYADNGLFFVYFTDRRGDSVLSRFAASAQPDRADVESEVEVLTFAQPFSNHNGGHLAFGPDGLLYLSTGDGGGSGDPQNNAQDLGSLLGKILRIDVDGLPYAIPPDNPFVGQSGARGEIWAYGLRNPWRFSFDRATGDMFIGDVGQGRQEEIDFQPAASAGGQNYGWRRKEGSLCFEPATGCNETGLKDPVLVYDHGPHCSVTGGYRYRGRSNAALRGIYLFGDFCSGVIWGGQPEASGVWSAAVLADTQLSIVSFGEDESGELYVVDRGGRLFRVAGSALVVDDFESGGFAAWKKAKGNLTIVQPGLRGSDHALQVALDGMATRSILVSAVPQDAASLSVRFLFNPGTVDLGREAVTVLALRGGGSEMLRLELAAKGAKYRARLWVRESDGSASLIGQTSLKKSATVSLGVEWVRASTAQGSDGLARLIKGRKVRAVRADLANSTPNPQSVRIGLPDGSEGTGSGSLLIDDVVITR
jgi:glucose/arabinose dehydrogenase